MRAEARRDLRADVLHLLQALLVRAGHVFEAREARAAQAHGRRVRGHGDREADQRAAQAHGPAAVDGLDHPVGRHVGDAVEGQQVVAGERVEVGRALELPRLVQPLDPLRAERLDVGRAARGPVDQPPDRLRGAGDVRAVELAAVALLGQRLPAGRALGGRDDLALLARPLRRVEHAGHEGDDVAGAAHEDGVADPDVARTDHLLVGERRARDGGAADEHRLEHGDGRDLADLADVPHDVGQHRGLLLGGVLVGERAARAVGARARGCVGVAVGEPQDGAVEVVVQRVPPRLDRGDHLLRLLGSFAVAHGRRLEAERHERRLQVALDAAARVEVEGEEAHAPPGHHGRILRAQRAGRGAAGIDQRLVGMGGVVGREGGAEHHELAPDLDALARLDGRGHAVAERPHEHGHVLARRAVSARDRPRQPALLVDERERHPVELGHDHDGLAGEAGEEGGDLLGRARLLE